MASLSKFRSISFSGAGFLGCYHIGVAACLLDHGHLLPPGERPVDETPLLTGVSAGALVSAGVSAGVSPQDSMNLVLEVGRKTRELGGIMDALRPGFSLIDEVNNLVLRNMKEALGGTPSNDYKDYDNDLLLERIRGGSLLRVGLAHREDFSPFKHRKGAYVYVDEYRDVDDVVAACILSSYVPGLTGPALGSNHKELFAVKHAMSRVKELERMGCIKSRATGKPVYSKNENENREGYWDGGLVDVWPVIDDSTVVVTPIMGNFEPNPYICPAPSIDKPTNDQSISYFEKVFPDMIQVSPRARVHMSKENLETMWRMAMSSEEDVLHDRFSRGYDDAARFLKENNLMSLYTTQALPIQ